jgi:hypothetical protein
MLYMFSVVGVNFKHGGLVLIVFANWAVAMDNFDYMLNIAVFYLVLVFVTYFIKETKSGLNISLKFVLYPLMAITFVYVGLSIGFATLLVDILISVILCVVFLPFLRVFLQKHRNR